VALFWGRCKAVAYLLCTYVPPAPWSAGGGVNTSIPLPMYKAAIVCHIVLCVSLLVLLYFLVSGGRPAMPVPFSGRHLSPFTSLVFGPASLWRQHDLRVTIRFHLQHAMGSK
jgi:hypothetical protein